MKAIFVNIDALSTAFDGYWRARNDRKSCWAIVRLKRSVGDERGEKVVVSPNKLKPE